ncbi:MAG: hypothetical protein Q7O66_12050, partial [Dehalococcoidia bacterium]|nr:hypothetical protein [Dehalococcoidia bacterium]
LEPKLWFCLATYLLRHHRPGPNDFSYRKRSMVGPLLLVVAFTTPVELLLVEMLVPWLWLRWVLLVLAVYALVWAFGFYASLIVLPHRLEAAGVRLHYGIFADGLVPYGEIVQIVRESRRAHGIGDGFRSVRKENAAYLAVGGRTDVTMHLRSGCSLNGLLSPTPIFATLHVAVDEPERLARELDLRRNSVSTEQSAMSRGRGDSPCPS